MELTLTEPKKSLIGRPKKNMNTMIENINTDDINVQQQIIAKQIKPRGRPKHIPTEEEIAEELRKKEEQNLLPKKIRPKTIREQEELIAYRKSYYEANKEKFNGDIICDLCQIRYGRSNRSRHIRSKMHLKNAIAQTSNEVEEK